MPHLLGKHGFWALLLLALVLRFLALLPASLHHPDEILQYLEPAHRLVFGHGIETWEYRYGMRGWLLPGVLSGPMALGEALAPGTGLYLFLPRLLAMLVTLLIPLGAFMLGRLVSPRHALLAMAVAAVWAETVFFSSHMLSEILGVAFFLPAAALIMAAGEGRGRVLGRLVLAGALLGISVSLRFHYAPAIAVFLLVECGLAIRARWLPLIGGGLAGLALAGLADLATGHPPLLWIVINLIQNIAHGRADHYGVDPVWRYVLLLGGYWLWAGPVIALCLLPALRRYRALIVAAAVNFVLLSLIGHKEYRFMLFTSTVCVVVAAIGSLDWIDRWRRGPVGAGGKLVLAMAFWAVLSASIAIGPFMRHRWTDDGPALLAARDAARLPGLCGLALHRLKFWQGGGQSFVHRDVPVYLTRWSEIDLLDPAGVARTSAAWNAVISADAGRASLPASYREVACHGEGDQRMCVLARPGSCDPQAAADWDLQSIMRRHDY